MTACVKLNRLFGFISTAFVLLGTSQVFAQDWLTLYQSREYAKILNLTAASELGSLSDVELYYRALSAAQNGELASARAAYTVLLGRDADFYAYKLSFDPDLAHLSDDPEFANSVKALPTGRLLDVKRTQRLVAGTHTLNWFRNGIRIRVPIASGASVADARLLDDSRVELTLTLPAVKQGGDPVIQKTIFDAKAKTFAPQQEASEIAK